MLESIEELRTFKRVVDEGSLSAAARSMGVSVNAISRRFAQLEERLGTKLANRTTRRFTLTDEGRRFADHCEQILASVEEAEEEVRPARDGLRGLVRLAVYPEMLRGELMDGLRGLLEEHDQLRLQVTSRSLPSDPRLSGLDLAIWPGEVPLQSVVARRLVEVRWVLACSRAYAERHGVPRSPKDLVRHSCLRAIRSRSETHWRLCDAKGREAEYEVTGRFESDDNDTLRAALLAGHGIGLRPRGDVVREVKRGRLVHVLPSYTFHRLATYLVAPQGRLRLARVRAVAGVLERSIKSMA